jgi:hypothetical protein
MEQAAIVRNQDPSDGVVGNMGNGFTVSPGVLQAGSGQLAGLRDEVDRAGSAAVSALIGAADSCGNGPVQAALSSFAKTTMQRFMDAMAGCQVTSDRLAQTSQQYRQADNLARQAAQAVQPPLLPGARPPLGVS